MAPRIGSNFYSAQPDIREEGRSGYSLGNSALGIGQTLTTRQTFMRPSILTSGGRNFLNVLPRAVGAIGSALTLGYNMKNTFIEDEARGDSSYTSTRREFVSSAASIAAGLGVGALGGAASAAVVVAGAPIWAGTAIAGLGIAGSIAASKYAYDWTCTGFDSGDSKGWW